MSNQHITNANEMRSDRYEIEPRPIAVGGGWRIRFFGRDLETGQEIEMGGFVIPIQDGQNEKDAYAEAEQAGQEWLQAPTWIGRELWWRQAQEESDETR